MNQALAKVWNVSQVPQRSPFRYPGGKTWIIPHVRVWLKYCRPWHLIEPFCGGASVGLAAAFENLSKKVTLVELDEDIASVWEVILNGGQEELVKRIVRFEMSRAGVEEAISKASGSAVDRAFATLLRNRVQHGGILAPGASLMNKGENSKGLSSRWYPQTLRRRIEAIALVKEKIRFIQGDALSIMRTYLSRTHVAMFIDPPYTIAGRRLYKYSEIDHDQLFWVASRASGSILMTYDRADEVIRLAKRYGFQVEEVAMSGRLNTEKVELLIGNDLAWVDGLVR